MEDKNLPVKVDNGETKSSNVDFLELLGIKIGDGKIEIDTNATKSFFDSVQKKVEEKAKDIESGIKDGKIDLKDSVGVKVDTDKIEIDLNKTKSFLEEITNRVQNFVESIDNTIKDISKKN